MVQAYSDYHFINGSQSREDIFYREDGSEKEKFPWQLQF